MPKLLSQSKHEEFKPNSALQIRDQKERRAENAKKLELQEIWQGVKFSQDEREIFAGCTVHPAKISFMPPLFIMELYSPLQPLFTSSAI